MTTQKARFEKFCHSVAHTAEGATRDRNADTTRMGKIHSKRAGYAGIGKKKVKYG